MALHGPVVGGAVLVGDGVSDERGDPVVGGGGVSVEDGGPVLIGGGVTLPARALRIFLIPSYLPCRWV